MQIAGNKSIVWQGTDDVGNSVKSGIYFIQFLFTHKITELPATFSYTLLHNQ